MTLKIIALLAVMYKESTIDVMSEPFGVIATCMTGISIARTLENVEQ